MTQLYVATIQVVIPVDDDVYGLGHQNAVAQDYIAETLRDRFTDWAYLKIGGQYQYPVSLSLDAKNYAEGDFLL